MRAKLKVTIKMIEKRLVLKASILIAISGILYGFLGYLGTQLLREGLSVSCMLFWRFFVAGLVMSVIVIHKHLGFSTKVAHDKKMLLSMFILGALGYAGASGLYFVTAKYTGTGLAMVIFFSYPITVVFFSWLIHRRRFRVMTLLCLIAMVWGLFLLRQPTEAGISYWGIFFGILSALSYTLYVMGTKRYASFKMDAHFASMMVGYDLELM